MLVFTKEILESKKVLDESGNEYPLHSETSLPQCEFIQKIINDIEATICLEIGLAYGISALFICEAISKRNNPKFISIDPFQQNWKDIGLLNLKKCGFDSFLDFYRDFSHNILPQLVLKDLKIDFAYIDGSKVFDVVLIHAYYLTRLLKIGGVMVFDDCDFPGINRVIRYISKWPHLKIYAKHHECSISSSERRVLSRIAKSFPRSDRIFSNRLLQLDEDLGINARCIAFQKIAEDERNWNWDADF